MVPNHSLCVFKRVSLKKGERESEILLKVPLALMAVMKKKEICGQQSFVLFSTSQPDDRSISLTEQSL